MLKMVAGMVPFEGVHSNAMSQMAFGRLSSWSSRAALLVVIIHCFLRLAVGWVRHRHI